MCNNSEKLFVAVGVEGGGGGGGTQKTPFLLQKNSPSNRYAAGG